MGLSVRPGDGQAQLSWRALPTATEGWQYQCPTGDCPGTWTDIANSGPSTTGYTVTGLTNNVSYSYPSCG